MTTATNSKPLPRGVEPIKSRTPRPLRWRVYTTLSWLHVYISMFSLLVILFFALTGISLNHPDWTFGDGETFLEYTGSLPDGWRNGDEVDWLVVVEHLRAQHGVRGQLAEYRADDLDGTLSFRAPGYSADAFFDSESGDYELAVMRLGAVGILDELHRAQDGSPTWRALVDIAGVFLAVLAVTGLGLLLYLRKYRRKGIITLAVGTVVSVILALLA